MDDEPSICTAYARLVRSAKMQPRTFASVEDFVSADFSDENACVISDVQMTAEERACCRTMKNQCGQMGMPTSHGCCQKTPPSVHDNALDTKPVTFHPVVVPVIWLAAPELVNPTSAVAGWVEHPDYSPPKSPPSAISILRI